MASSTLHAASIWANDLLASLFQKVKGLALSDDCDVCRKIERVYTSSERDFCLETLGSIKELLASNCGAHSPFIRYFARRIISMDLETVLWSILAKTTGLLLSFLVRWMIVLNRQDAANCWRSCKNKVSPMALDGGLILNGSNRKDFTNGTAGARKATAHAAPCPRIWTCCPPQSRSISLMRSTHA